MTKTQQQGRQAPELWRCQGWIMTEHPQRWSKQKRPAVDWLEPKVYNFFPSSSKAETMIVWKIADTTKYMWAKGISTLVFRSLDKTPNCTYEKASTGLHSVIYTVIEEILPNTPGRDWRDSWQANICLFQIHPCRQRKLWNATIHKLLYGIDRFLHVTQSCQGHHCETPLHQHGESHEGANNKPGCKTLHSKVTIST